MNEKKNEKITVDGEKNKKGREDKRFYIKHLKVTINF